MTGETATARAKLDRLTTAVARATGAATDALMAKLAETQERLTTSERRQREVADRLTALDGQNVDPAAVGRALARFTNLWDVLLAPERERVVRLLIDQIEYGGASGKLTITFSATGSKLFAAEVGS